MIRVAVIGNHQHHHCSEAQWARAFAKLGCAVTALQIDDVVRDPEGAMGVLRQHTIATYTRTHSPGRYLDRSWTDRWAELERAGVRTVGLHLDRFFDLEREHLAHEGDAQFTVGQCWTADGGNDERWAAAGVNHRWLVPAIDPDDVQGGVRRRELAYDVVFVGSGGSYHAAYPERLDLLAHLRSRYGRAFAHFGHGGDMPVVRGQELSDLYRSAKVVVGDTCFVNRVRPADRYLSDRLFESIGRGAFTVWPWSPCVSDFYTTGRHFVTHVPGDWTDLDTMIDGYLAMPDARAEIAAQGQQHTLAEHTWAHRMGSVLVECGLPMTAESCA